MLHKFYDVVYCFGAHEILIFFKNAQTNTQTHTYKMLSSSNAYGNVLSIFIAMRWRSVEWRDIQMD